MPHNGFQLVYGCTRPGSEFTLTLEGFMAKKGGYCFGEVLIGVEM